jgi:hypothetical protein
MKILAEDIDIPEVPIPRRIMLAQRKRIAALKRAKKKMQSGQNLVRNRSQK